MRSKFEHNPGDIFSVPVKNGFYFFQYLMNNNTLFSANIIRVFDFNGLNEEIAELDDLLSCKIKFVAHTFIKGGIKLCNWKLIGNLPLENDFNVPLFRATDDVYSQTKCSKKWFIWKAGEKEQWIGKLKKKYKNIAYGTVYHPIDITEWIENGDNGFLYPA